MAIVKLNNFELTNVLSVLKSYSFAKIKTEGSKQVFRINGSGIPDDDNFEVSVKTFPSGDYQFFNTTPHRVSDI